MTACIPRARMIPGLRRSLVVAAGACAIALMQGCVSQTLLVKNEKASAEVKARGYGDYKQVLFIPPKEDPRQVTPRAVKELETMGFKVRVMDPSKPLEASQGTGFLITAQGHLLTCAHVVEEEKTATVFLQGRRLLADVVATNKDDDLALLKLRDPAPAGAQPLGFRTEAPGMGDDVFTIGYPLSRLLGNNARMSRGLLSATTGMRDDTKRMQVSAEVQPGNSGGPLLARDGQVIYVAIWDVWYRFRLFVVAAHDFDTQEVLFVVGQGRDNLVSNEEVVIKDTFNKFREAIGRPAPAP